MEMKSHTVGTPRLQLNSLLVDDTEKLVYYRLIRISRLR